MCTYIRTYVHVYVCTCIQTCILLYVLTYVRTYVRMYIFAILLLYELNHLLVQLQPSLGVHIGRVEEIEGLGSSCFQTRGLLC